MEEKKREVELFPVHIIDDTKQMSIRIPKGLVEALDIDSKKDLFVFQFDKTNLQLEGSLEDKQLWEKEFGKNKE